MPDNTSQFINKFQEFEKLLKQVTNSTDETRFLDCIKKYSQKSQYFKDNYHTIEDLYALRNVFSHRNRGEDYIAQINEFAVLELDRLIERLKNPPNVLSKYRVDVYQAQTTDSLSEVIKEMKEKTYTHVPIWEGDNFVGVFAYSTLFELIGDELDNGSGGINLNELKLGDIKKKYLNSPCVNFEFIEQEKSIDEIPSLFEEKRLQRKRLDCLFITKNGKKGQEITGIITPWDLGRN